MKALPDEEGIETLYQLKSASDSCMKALPDEEGIETHISSRIRSSIRYEGTP